MSTVAAGDPCSPRATSSARVNQLVLELSTAALDPDESTARRILAAMLARIGRRSDEKFQEQLRAIELLFLALRSGALIDRLTALYNRRGFLRIGSRLLDTVRRDRQGALLFYLDIDGLKSINDSAGIDAGDAVLVRTAQLLRSVFRNRDIVSRLGGDEFAVLALSSDPSGSDVMVDRLNEAIRANNARANNAAGAPPRLSLSVGVAQFDPAYPLSMAALMQEADVAKYGKKMARFLKLPSVVAS